MIDDSSWIFTFLRHAFDCVAIKVLWSCFVDGLMSLTHADFWSRCVAMLKTVVAIFVSNVLQPFVEWARHMHLQCWTPSALSPDLEGTCWPWFAVASTVTIGFFVVVEVVATHLVTQKTNTKPFDHDDYIHDCFQSDMNLLRHIMDGQKTTNASTRRRHASELVRIRERLDSDLESRRFYSNAEIVRALRLRAPSDAQARALLEVVDACLDGRID